MAIDIQHLFNVMLPAQLAKHPDQAKQIGAKYQFIIAGEGGGEWYVDASPSGPSCRPGSPGSPGSADCTITMSVEDLQKLLENPQANGMALFFAGKIKAAGNQMLVMRFLNVFMLGS